MDPTTLTPEQQRLLAALQGGGQAFGVPGAPMGGDQSQTGAPTSIMPAPASDPTSQPGGVMGSIGGLLSGMGNALNPSVSDPNAVDPQTGFRAGDLAMAKQGQMGQLGMMLLAAAQKMSGAQRGQLLASAAGNLQSPVNQVLNASQARLMQANLGDKVNQQAQRAQLIKQINAMPVGDGDGQISASAKAWALSNPEDYFKWQTQQDESTTDLERKINALEDIGLDKATATKAVLGVLPQTTVDKMGGRVTIDPLSGQIVNSQPSAFQQLITGGGGGLPAQGQGQGQPAPQTAPAGPPVQGPPMPPVQGPPMPPVPGPPMPPVPGQGPTAVAPNPADVFGFGPAASLHVTAPLAEFFGNDLNPEQQRRIQGANNINALNNRLMSALGSDIDGRPTNFTRELAGGLLPEPGHPFTGPSEALNKYKAIGQRVDEQISQTQQALALAVTGQDMARAQAAKAKLNELSSVRQDLYGTINGLQQGIETGRAANQNLARDRGLASGWNSGSGGAPARQGNPYLGAAQSYLGGSR